MPLRDRLREHAGEGLRRAYAHRQEAGAATRSTRSRRGEHASRRGGIRGGPGRERASRTSRRTSSAAPSCDRPTHRRPRHAHGAADRLRGRPLAARAWLGPLHPRRDAGAGGRDARHRPGRADHRRARRRVPRALPAALQFPALFDRRGSAAGLARTARDRPRQARMAGGAGAAARQGEASPTRSASSPRSPNRTAPPRWRRCAAPRSR